MDEIITTDEMEIRIRGISTSPLHEMKFASIKPNGFWSDMVNIYQAMDFQTRKPEEAEISWGSGGTDGSLSNAETVISFMAALKKALEIKAEWDQKIEEARS